MTRAIFSSKPLGTSTLRALLGAAILALSLPLPNDASAASLQVDDDGVQCANAGFTTLQAAVAAAVAGDTIKVCPGTYTGQVVVDKALKIKGKALAKPKVAPITRTREAFCGAKEPTIMVGMVNAIRLPRIEKNMR